MSKLFCPHRLRLCGDVPSTAKFQDTESNCEDILGYPGTGRYNNLTAPAKMIASSSLIGTKSQWNKKLSNSDSVFEPVSTVSLYPHFIRPSVNPTAECDIFGPLCQTGSITVGVSTSTTTTTTVVPCSYYLLAQSASVPPINHTGLNKSLDPWYSIFARSPQCTSFAGALNPQLSSKDALTLSRCPSNVTNSGKMVLSTDKYVPAGVSIRDDSDQTGKQDTWCCGPCNIFIRGVKVIAFPDNYDHTCSHPGFTTPQMDILTGSSEKIRTAVSNGFTL